MHDSTPQPPQHLQSPRRLSDDHNIMTSHHHLATNGTTTTLKTGGNKKQHITHAIMSVFNKRKNSMDSYLDSQEPRITVVQGGGGNPIRPPRPMINNYSKFQSRTLPRNLTSVNHLDVPPPPPPKTPSKSGKFWVWTRRLNSQESSSIDLSDDEAAQVLTTTRSQRSRLTNDTFESFNKFCKNSFDQMDENGANDNLSDASSSNNSEVITPRHRSNSVLFTNYNETGVDSSDTDFEQPGMVIGPKLTPPLPPTQVKNHRSSSTGRPQSPRSIRRELSIHGNKIKKDALTSTSSEPRQSLYEPSKRRSLHRKWIRKSSVDKLNKQNEKNGGGGSYGGNTAGSRSYQFDVWDGRNAMTLPRRSNLEDDSDKNEVGSVDNKNSSNQQLKLKGHHHHQRGAVGGNNGDVVGGQQRPQSMMINRPPQYPVGNPAGHRPQQRPQSTIYSSGRYGSNNVTNNSLDSVFQRPVSESPDEIEDPDDEFEEELLMKQNEAEAWSITVDKKTIKKMGKKDIKRQEIIYEFIQTERNYLATLIIMQKIFARGMSEELQLDPSTISKLFPYIDEHVKFVRKFVKLLLERQQDNKLVRRIGDLFLAHWSGSSGDEMKKLFGAFCSCNNEMNAMYKELNKNDKKFAAFVKKVKEDPRTKRKGIPECYLLVTQRITKYPIMVQTLLENTNKKENQEDHRDIEQALDLSRQIAKGVDEQVRDRERLLKLQDIHEKTDPRSSTIVKGRKFDRKDFFARNRKLSFCSDTVQLKVQRNKPIDVFLVVLSDCIVVLHENNGKYFFVTTTIAVLKLKKLILREVAYHNLGLLLINAASADMIEIRFSSSDLRKKMISLIRTAVGHCPEDGPDSDDDADSERQSQESKIKSEKWNELFTKLHEKDEQMAQVMEERINCFKQYQPHILSSSNIDGGDTAIFYPMLHHSKSEYDEGRLQFPPTAPLLQTLADFAGKLSNSMSEYNGEEDDDVNLLGNNISLSPKQQTNEQTTTTSIMTSSSSSELLTTKHQHQHGGSSDSSDASPDISSAPKSSWVTGDSPTRDHVTSVENGGSMTSLRSYSTYHMLESMKQLSILCNNYISHAQQQDSYVAKLYSIMEQERSRKHKPGNLLEEAELKRNQVKQEEQLDELRKEQQKLKSQQDNFERYKERQMRNIEQQDKKLEEQKAELQRASDKNNSDRDEIQLQKEELQRELGRVRAMRKSDNNQQTTTMTSSLPGSVPPSSTSSTASLLMNKNNSSSNNQARSSSMSRVVMGEQSSSSSSSVTSSTRSSSLRAASPTPPSGSASGDYLRASKRGEMTSSSSAMSELPIHLQYSATNQMTAGRTTAQQQQLFTKNLSKLAKNDGKTSKESKHHHTKSSLSSKLSSLSSGGGNQQQQTTNCNTTTGDSRLLMPPTTTTHRHHQKQLSEPQQLFAMRRPNSPRLLMSGGTSTNNLSTLRHLPYPTITTTASGAPPHMTSSSPPTSYPSSTTTADIGAATNIGRRSDAARRQSSASSSGSGPRLSAKRRGGHSTNSSDREEDIELFL